MTKGMKSSEFYLSAGTVISIILSSAIGINLDPVALSAIIGTIASYIVSRGMAKTEHRADV